MAQILTGWCLWPLIVERWKHVLIGFTVGVLVATFADHAILSVETFVGISASDQAVKMLCAGFRF